MRVLHWPFLTLTITMASHRAEKYNHHHQPKSDDWRRTNCSATPRMTAKDNRRYTHWWASHGRIRAWETYRWQTRVRISSATGPNDPKTQKLNWAKSKPWARQVSACLARLASWTKRRASVACRQLERAGDTLTRSTQQWQSLRQDLTKNICLSAY